ncbi:hypothetical protein SAMN05414139_02296 [Burkholderia sp. D7]|nr:hypothetical protein SAMN05414139_02296 [Burkholderia sp. D7]
MHPEFPKLFSEISADGAERDKRWAGVEAFVSTHSIPRIEVLVRLAFETKPPAGGHRQEELEQALAAFHKAFSDLDPSFEPGARQDQVLAAAALLQFSMERALPAIAVATTACGGARKANLPIDLITSAENALTRLSATRRKRPDLSNLKVESPEFAFELDFSGVQPNQPQTFKGLFDQFQKELDEALLDMTEKFNGSLAKVANANKMADEELDMLSWVFGGRSLVTDEAFGEVTAVQKPLVFARDIDRLRANLQVSRRSLRTALIQDEVRPRWSTSFRFCRQCLGYGYHSILHQFESLNVCPAHHCAVESACRRCGHEIPYRINVQLLEAQYRCANCLSSYPNVYWTPSRARPMKPGHCKAFTRRYMDRRRG